MTTSYASHPEVALDLEEIWEFVAKNSPKASNRIVDAILDALDVLVLLPNTGHSRLNLTSRPLRFIVVHDYLVQL